MGIIYSSLQPVYYPFYKWTVMNSILLWISIKQIQICRCLTHGLQDFMRKEDLKIIDFKEFTRMFKPQNYSHHEMKRKKWKKEAIQKNDKEFS